MSGKSFYICTRYVDKFVLIATTEKNAKTKPLFHLAFRSIIPQLLIV